MRGIVGAEFRLQLELQFRRKLEQGFGQRIWRGSGSGSSVEIGGPDKDKDDGARKLDLGQQNEEHDCTSHELPKEDEYHPRVEIPHRERRDERQGSRTKSRMFHPSDTNETFQLGETLSWKSTEEAFTTESRNSKKREVTEQAQKSGRLISSGNLRLSKDCGSSTPPQAAIEERSRIWNSAVLQETDTIISREAWSENFKRTMRFTPGPTPKKTRIPLKTALCLPCLADCGSIQSKEIRITSLLKSCMIKEWNNSGTCMLMAWCLACTC
jgi:hypothetical protein